MRIAAVRFLNARPLLHGLPWDTTLLLPAEMTPTMVAPFPLILAPVVLAFQDPRWHYLLEAPAIGCCGAVGSVRLECAPGHDLTTVRRIALSPHSQSSNALLRILWQRYWQRDPAAVEWIAPNGEPLADHVPADAQLIIGDEALTCAPGPHAIDLGQAWHEWTGLPFVFACWMATDSIDPSWAPQLCRTREHNLANLSTLLENDSHTVHEHFKQQLSYEFGPTQHQGLARFREEYSRAVTL